MRAMLMVFLCAWGSGLSWARGPSIVEVPEYVDTARGRPFLFFLSEGRIVARECDPAGIAPGENGCRPLSGSVDFSVDRGRFVEILKLLLVSKEGNYTSEIMAEMELYRRIQGGQSMGRAVAAIAKLKENKGVVTSPTDILVMIDDLLRGNLCVRRRDSCPPPV